MDKGHEPKEQVAARVREALAKDPRVNELHLSIKVRGDTLEITGVVATPDRQRAVAEVAAEIASGYRILNATTTAVLEEIEEVERLS